MINFTQENNMSELQQIFDDQAAEIQMLKKERRELRRVLRIIVQRNKGLYSLINADFAKAMNDSTIEAENILYKGE